MKDFSKNLVVHKRDNKIPMCEVEGCSHKAQWNGNVRKDGSKIYRRRSDTGYVCTEHHHKLTGKSKGLSSRDWVNSWHTYRWARKDYCENIDGRLGFTCTTTIAWSGMLDVDHKDGNHLNNDLENFQTLCKCCHSYKTNMEKDYLSPGRKTRKVI